MSDSDDSQKDFEKLSKALTEAVLKSQKVRKIVSDIQKDGKVCGQSFMVLVLNLQSLMDSLDIENHDMPAENKPAPKSKKKKSAPPQFVDGDRLTDNEKAFLQFLQDRFDSDEWLKKNGLKL